MHIAVSFPFAYQMLQHPIQLRQPIFQLSFVRTILVQRSNFSASGQLPPPKDSESASPLINHKDWLSPSEVFKVFDSLKDPSSAFDVLNQISKRKDYNPNEALYSIVIKKLALAKRVDAIDALLEKIKLERKCRLSDDFFYNVLKIYGHLFGRINKVINTLFTMPSCYKCWPSVRTFNFVLNLLVSNKQFDVVHEVYMGASKLGVEVDACSLNIIIKGLCQCGQLDAALHVVNEFPKQNCRPNVRTYSTIMHGLSARGRVDEALELLERMEKEDIEVDAITFNILINGLRKVGRVDEGVEVFNRMMIGKGCDPNVGTYQEVLYCLLDAKKFSVAKKFVSEMLSKGVHPSFDSYKLMLNGFCNESDVENMDWVLKQMVRQGFIPKMGMWKQIVRCLVKDSNQYEEIIG